jgi:Xaa-Pro aminopeptidase
VPSGYCSDMGRNIPLAPNPEVEDYLNRAVEAHKQSIKLIREGVLGSDVLEGSNKINTEYGFDPMVRCGHQIGLECHDYTMPFPKLRLRGKGQATSQRRDDSHLRATPWSSQEKLENTL